MSYQGKAKRALEDAKRPGGPLSDENISKADNALQWAHQKMMEERVAGPMINLVVDLEEQVEKLEQLVLYFYGCTSGIVPATPEDVKKAAKRHLEELREKYGFGKSP